MIHHAYFLYQVAKENTNNSEGPFMYPDATRAVIEHGVWQALKYVTKGMAASKLKRAAQTSSGSSTPVKRVKITTTIADAAGEHRDDGGSSSGSTLRGAATKISSPCACQ